MARNKKETSTEVKKENKKKVTKKPVELNDRTSSKTVTTKRSNVTPSPQAEFVTGGGSNTDVVNANYIRVGDLTIPLTGGTISCIHNTGTTTYIDGSVLGNTSSNTAITNIEKIPFTNPEFPNMLGGGQVGYIAPVKPKEDILNSIESELIELNNKMGELASRNVNNLYNLTYQELFEIKKHLAETVQKHHYPGSTGNIYMMQAQRRYEIIVSEINNKLNVLFGDV